MLFRIYYFRTDFIREKALNLKSMYIYQALYI